MLRAIVACSKVSAHSSTDEFWQGFCNRRLCNKDLAWLQRRVKAEPYGPARHWVPHRESHIERATFHRSQICIEKFGAGQTGLISSITPGLWEDIRAEQRFVP